MSVLDSVAFDRQGEVGRLVAQVERGSRVALALTDAGRGARPGPRKAFRCRHRIQHFFEEYGYIKLYSDGIR